MVKTVTAGTKGRILFLLHYFREYTDDAHTVTGETLIRACEQRGYEANRNTLRDDIASLNAAGIEILIDRVGNRNFYHMGARLFEPAELRMLVDAVASSRALTEARSAELVEKITRLTSEHNRAGLTARVAAAHRVRTDSAGTLRNTDTICQAIDRKVQITFQYLDYDAEGQRVLRHDGERYVLSPWALIWNEDRYYVVGHTDKHPDVTTFRVDRMVEPELTDEPAIISEDFDPSRYADRAFRMYNDGRGDTLVELRCENDMHKHIVDRFGEGAIILPMDEAHFLAAVQVMPSATFFAWVFQYAGAIRIAWPDRVREDYEQMLSRAAARQKGEGEEDGGECGV